MINIIGSLDINKVKLNDIQMRGYCLRQQEGGCAAQKESGIVIFKMTQSQGL